LAHPVAGDVDALAVHLDEAVVDELAGLRAGRGPAGAGRHVVEALLEQPQQGLTRRAGEAGGLLLGAGGLSPPPPPDVPRLLLLLQLGEVLTAVVATAGATVGAGREGPALEGPAPLLVLEDVGAEAARQAHLRTGVASHVSPSAAWGGGSRCAAPA